MRRFTVEVMRRLDGAGVDCVLPDLPGTNESVQQLGTQGVEDWLDAMAAAALHFGASHVLGIRGGCLFTPDTLPGWHYAAVKGGSVLRQMLRARMVSAREAGRDEAAGEIMDQARADGIEMCGYRLGADMVRGLETLEPRARPGVSDIAQGTLGAAGLWLRAEPGEDPAQADALAAIVALGTGA